MQGGSSSRRPGWLSPAPAATLPGMSPKQPPSVNDPRPPEDLGNPTERLIECSHKLLEGWFVFHNIEKLSFQQRNLLTDDLYATMNAVANLLRTLDPGGSSPRFLAFSVLLNRFGEALPHRQVPR